MIETASRSHLATPTTKSYVLTTLAKLTSRFGDEHKPRIEEMIGGFKTSMSLELQQRSCEVVFIYFNISIKPWHIDLCAPCG